MPIKLKSYTATLAVTACLCLALAGCGGSGGSSNAVTPGGGNGAGDNGGNPGGDNGTGDNGGDSGGDNGGNGDMGGDNMGDTGVTPPPAGQSGPKTRYALNNQCFTIRANGNGRFVAQNGDGYAATSTEATNAEAFLMRPTALGKDLIYNSDGQLLTANASALAPGITNVNLADAVDGSEWTLTGVGDTTVYPDTPVYDQEPTPEYFAAYRSFNDPNLEYEDFTVFSATSASNLVISNTGRLEIATPDASVTAQGFQFEPGTGCAIFPEAQSNVVGTPFSGTQPDGSVLGMADVHVHISATTFLGGAQWGSPFHRFGVEHALGDCAVEHGPQGSQDAVGSLLAEDMDGHNTTGWPTFPEWPARDSLTHEAIYWKWLERAWASGLRIAVNDLVENNTLCELQRNFADTDGTVDPTQDCNSMNKASDQVGTMLGMQDYIDAQYGGRGEGWFQVVVSPSEARSVIADGKLAVVLGIEISNLFDPLIFVVFVS